MRQGRTPDTMSAAITTTRWGITRTEISTPTRDYSLVIEQNNENARNCGKVKVRARNACCFVGSSTSTVITFPKNETNIAILAGFVAAMKKESPEAATLFYDLITYILNPAIAASSFSDAHTRLGEFLHAMRWQTDIHLRDLPPIPGIDDTAASTGAAAAAGAGAGVTPEAS